MIFVDASAITSAIGNEASADAVLGCLEAGGSFFTTPIAVYEAVMAVARISNSSLEEATGDVMNFLEQSAVSLEPVLPVEAKGAISACARFGKGRHPAKLNMGDCFAYASARTRQASILFVGSDFSHTDLVSAMRTT